MLSQAHLLERGRRGLEGERGLQRSGEGLVRRDLTRHKGKREFRRRNERKKKKKNLETVRVCCYVHAGTELRVHSGCFRAGARPGTYSVVDGDERSVATLPCLLSCCSLGEDGSESVISSISSWADWDLVFFLLNACLKELRNCEAETQKKTAWGQYRRPLPSRHNLPDREATPCFFPKQSSLAGLSKDGG